MSIELPFEIEFLSDYHVGAGHGSGLVDSSLLRDGDGMPVIRGSAITGLLRDAVWQMMQQGALAAEARCQQSGLLSGRPFCAPGPDACPICRVFGVPGEPKRWRIGSARPVERPAAGWPEPGKAVGGTEVQRVRISPRTRRAVPRALFRQEHGERTWKMAFTLSTARGDAPAMEEAALLVAAARAIRGLGRARRRGQGVCRFHLKDKAAEKGWLEQFATRWLEGVPLAGQATATAALPALPASGAPLRLRLVARADEPFLLAQRAEAGNEFAGALSLPGTVVLGALAGRAAARFNLEQDVAAKEAFVQVFLRGRLRFSALLPAKLGGPGLLPTIPAPLDLLTCKAFPGFAAQEHPHSVKGYALSEEPPEHCPDCPPQPGTPLVATPGFVPICEKPETFKPSTQHEMHIAVDPATGRVAGDALYGYVAVQAGHFFVGEVACSDQAAWRVLKQMADLPDAGTVFEVHVGRAGQRGYGRMTLVIEEVRQDAVSPWHGLPLTRRVPGSRKPDELVMTLLTDAVLPDAWLRGRVGFDEEWLKSLLGADVKIVRSFCRSRPVDGFFGQVGLPRWRDISMVAGSAVGIRFPSGPPPNLLDTLAGLEREGIGLRRDEGYGQVVFNHPIYDRREDLYESGLDLPKALRPELGKEPASEERSRFLREWEARLAKTDPGTWKRTGFEAVARILREGASGPVQALVARMGDDFGRPDALLGHGLGGSHKEKKNVEETRKGRAEIADLLDTLEKAVASHPAQAAGLLKAAIEMLADRVGQGAAEARKAKEGGR